MGQCGNLLRLTGRAGRIGFRPGSKTMFSSLSLSLTMSDCQLPLYFLLVTIVRLDVEHTRIR